MRNLKLRKLLNLSSVLAISLSAIGFMGGGASAATQTVNLPRNQVVDTTSYYAGTTSGPTWANLFGSGVVVHHPGSSDDDLSGTYNGANIYSRGWNFNAGLICEGASLSTLSITNNLKRPGTFAAAGERDFATSLALAGQSSLPVISRTHGIDMATIALPSYANITSIGDTADNNSLAQSGGANVTIVYNVSGLTKSQLSQLALTYIIDPESSTASSPTATLTYDNSTCPNSTPTISPSSTTTIPSTTASGTQVVSGSSLSASDPDGNTLAYSITAGNGGGYFTINTSTGDISTTQANIPAGTYTLTVQVDDGNGGTATSTVTIVVTDGSSPTPTSYCPSPGSTTQALSPTGDCDNDGITNQEEGYDPDGDGNPTTGTSSIDTDKDGTPDYIDTDSDNDKLTDKQEGTKDTNNNKIPDFRDPTKTLANTGMSLNLILGLSALAIVAGFSLKKVRG